MLDLMADASLGHMDLDGGWWVAMLVGMLLFWTLIALAIGWGIREINRSHRATPGEAVSLARDPIGILDERLASGDISPEEYRERRELLEGR